MNREEIVRAVVIAVRTQIDGRRAINSEFARGMCEQAWQMADDIEELDDNAQQIIIGFCTKAGAIALPKSGNLVTYKDQAKVMSDALRAPKPKPRYGEAPPDPEREARKDEVARELVVRIRPTLDPRERLSAERCTAFRRDAEQLAEQLVDLDADTRAVVVGMCVHAASFGRGAILQNWIDQGKLISAALAVPKPERRD